MDIITEQLNLLPVDYKAFVLSPFSMVVAESIRAEYGLTAATENAAQDGILLFLLFLFTESELHQHLVKEAGLSDAQAVECSETMMALLPDDFPWELISSETDLQKEISSLQDAVSHLEPIRTMAGDMGTYSKEQIYASNQDEILGKREDDSPRWETDNR